MAATEPFQWDRENLAHIARHSVAPGEAVQVLCNLPIAHCVYGEGIEDSCRYPIRFARPTEAAILEDQGTMAGKPRNKIAIPVFRSESDEAEWWASPKGRKYLADQFDRGAKLGTLRVGTPTNVAQLIRPAPPSSLSVAVSLRIPQSDVDKAKAVARRKGMAYQTYLKMLVHEALAREVV